MTVRDTFRYTPSYSNVGGFLVWEHSDLDTHPLTIPDKQPDSYLIYTCQHTVQVKYTSRVSIQNTPTLFSGEIKIQFK